MRKIAILILAIALLAVVAGPAQAGKATKTKTASLSANAFWYTTEWLSQTSYRSTVWYVGVYQDSGETFSDLYFDSSICEVTPPEDTCTSESSRYGFSDLSGQTFTLDAKELDSAHLDAVYELQDYDADFTWSAIQSRRTSSPTGRESARSLERRAPTASTLRAGSFATSPMA